ncbi:hypothetical protein M3Y97_01096000 [Aphelenchoides bicaudatus]|nr:hypothetical protein M3Y97_01096000 [Aphelenchoides bicaudatus]
MFLVKKDQFNPELSTTFEKINMTDGFKNSGGRDLVEVSKGETKSLPFLIYTGPVSWTQASELYLSRSTYNITNSFLTELLKDYKEKVVGITYEKSEDAKIPPGIKLTIGGRPKDVCGEWHYLISPAERPYFSSENDWLVEMDGLKIDDKSVNLTNKVATFALTGYNGIRFGDPDEENIMPLLLEGHLDTDEAVKQMAEKEMVYEIGGLKFRTTVKPKNFYIPKREPDPDEINDCRPPYEQNPHHILPHAVLYDKCLLLDFEKKLIAVANRK